MGIKISFIFIPIRVFKKIVSGDNAPDRGGLYEAFRAGQMDALRATFKYVVS
jgi:hypothetical protein